MQGDRIHLQAGAGIVADSDPAHEFEESENKLRAWGRRWSRPSGA
jgi:anthranilate synthase component 1